MQYIPLQYQAGTAKKPQLTELQSAVFSDTSGFHFPDNVLRTIPEWSDVTPSNSNFNGVPRTIFGCYTTAYHYLFGTHSGLYVMKNGTLTNITPLADQKAELLGSDPISTTSGDATVTITWAAHGLSVGDALTLLNAEAVGGFSANSLNTEHTVATVPSADTVTIEMGSTAGSTATGGGDLIVARSIGVTKTLGTNPIRSLYDNQATISANAFTFTSGSTIVSVRTTILDSILTVGESFTIAGVASTYAGVPASELNGTHIVRSFDGNGYPQIYVTTPATSTSTPATSGVTATAAKIRIAETAHGRVVGDRIKLRDATGPVGGIPANEINVEHEIIALDGANAYVVNVTTEATSYVDGGGTVVRLYEQMAAGNESQSIGYGFGGGNFSNGNFGTGKNFTSALSYPRIWSIDVYGDEVLLNAGDYNGGDGQKIYIWQNDTSVAPVVLTNAPTDVNFVYESQNAVVALAGKSIKISGINNATTWTPAATNTAFTDDIERVNRLIRGIRARNTDVLFTEDEVLTLTYVGSTDLWEIDDIMQSDGLYAPNAVSAIEETIYWMGKRGFYYFDGSAVQRIPNPLNEDWIYQNINSSQKWKVFCKPDAENNQVWWFFPTGSSSEPTDYVIYNYRHGHWTLGKRDLTATQQPSGIGGLYYSAKESAIYSDNLDEGTEALNAYAEISDSYMMPDSSRARIDRILVDGSGSYDIIIKTKEWANGAETTGSTLSVTDSTEYVIPKIAGKIVSFRFESDRCTIGALKLLLKAQGRRG